MHHIISIATPLHRYIYILFFILCKTKYFKYSWSLWAEWFMTQSFLVQRIAHQTHMITWNQVNRDVFPTWKRFVGWVAVLFDSDSWKVKVKHWACCLERHKDGGKHCHMLLILCGPETSSLICSANQWTGFYMITASGLSGKNNAFEKHGLSSIFQRSTATTTLPVIKSGKTDWNICKWLHSQFTGHLLLQNKNLFGG